MGMFDYMRCHYPLPVAGANELLYQTKDLLDQMDSFEIRDDGTLWHEDYEIEDRSDPKATGLWRLMGMLTRVNKRWVRDTTFLGRLRFYTSWRERPPYGWIEWEARVIDGKVESIVLIENEPPQHDESVGAMRGGPAA